MGSQRVGLDWVTELNWTELMAAPHLSCGMQDLYLQHALVPVVKTPHSQCRVPGFNPWSGNWIHLEQLRIHMPQLRVCMLQLITVVPESLYPLSNVILLPPSSSWQRPIYSLFLGSWFYFLDFTYKRDHALFVFLWLLLLRVMSSSPIHVVAQAGFPSFYGWIIVHCMYRPHLLYPFISQWTFRLCPCLGYCE